MHQKHTDEPWVRISAFLALHKAPLPNQSSPSPKGDVELWPGRGARGQSMRSLLLVPLASTKMHEDPQEDFQDTCKRPAGKLHDFEIDFQEPPRIDLQEASKRMTLGPQSRQSAFEKGSNS